MTSPETVLIPAISREIFPSQNPKSPFLKKSPKTRKKIHHIYPPYMWSPRTRRLEFTLLQKYFLGTQSYIATLGTNDQKYYNFWKLYRCENTEWQTSVVTDMENLIGS